MTCAICGDILGKTGVDVAGGESCRRCSGEVGANEQMCCLIDISSGVIIIDLGCCGRCAGVPILSPGGEGAGVSDAFLLNEDT